MDAARALIVLLPLAGCSAAPQRPERAYAHPASAEDVRLNEALDAAPEEKLPPTILDYAWKTPLVVPTLAIAWGKDMPRALAEFALTPVVLVGALLEAAGILKPERSPRPPKPAEPDR